MTTSFAARAAKRVRELMDARGLDAPNGSPAYAGASCTAEGMPWQMTHGLPIDIRQVPLTVTLTFTGEQHADQGQPLSFDAPP